MSGQSLTIPIVLRYRR